MIAREIAVYAAAQNLTVREPYRDGPVDAAILGWLWMRSEAPESLEAFLEALFHGYWSLEIDAGDVEEVSKVVGGCGADVGLFVAWAAADGPAAGEAVAIELANAGVFQAPATLVCDQVFYGRQHLPMVRWLLEGEVGRIPI